ncbi:metal-dependent phosphohydrolase [Catenulispora sp. NF23]|uniref:Metal-dependent phosphohydrolase n=1 Tax=Catenulispora pinistramenti TaxID=2705254 RepID=A0ABS5KUZ2_9ACTN|nr:metal-dependent phosphohydrolase [Catenulispora pinistramenti]MBS2538148.1 metal-dependent phosphohydrolase [Catenulispora pinistramenti]MBS2549824.1 metal-dependent phosphohydrolase [Catenulispora pinistramenti]
MALSLHDRWLILAGITPESTRLGNELVARWAEPHRRYHTLEHLTRVLDGVDEFGGFADDVAAVRFAAWFHDAVYDGGAASADNEELSAQLAEAELPVLGVPEARVAEVARLVRLTKGHAVADGDRNGAVLCDADLAVLGGDATAYGAYAEAIRQEYAEVPDELFRPGRAAVLRGLLELPELFRTPVAVRRYDARARANLSAEIAALER